MVSLALALSLSDLVSNKTSIDSLFLEEGFGSLDGDTLEIALTALDSLNASGRNHRATIQRGDDGSRTAVGMVPDRPFTHSIVGLLLSNPTAAKFRDVDLSQVHINLGIEQNIVEAEQEGDTRAACDGQLRDQLTVYMSEEFKTSFLVTNLKIMKQPYML